MKHVITITFETSDALVPTGNAQGIVDSVYAVAQDAQVQLETLEDDHGICYQNADMFYTNSAGIQASDPADDEDVCLDCEREECECVPDEPEETDPQLRALKQLRAVHVDPNNLREIDEFIVKREKELGRTKQVVFDTETSGLNCKFDLKHMMNIPFYKVKYDQPYPSDEKKCACSIQDLCTQGCKCGGK